MICGLRRLLPPSLRCDCREAGFFPQRKHLHQQFFGTEQWRCPAPEFLWGRDNLAVACGRSTGSQKRSFERFCVDVSGKVLLAYWTLCDMAFVLCLVCSMMFSSIPSPRRMDFLISSTIRQLPRSPPTQVQSTWCKTFTTRAEASPSRIPRQNGMEVPCWRAPLELLGTVPDVCGDCTPLDTLLGSGTTLVEFWRFAF